jgi:hypothetical protein
MRALIAKYKSEAQKILHEYDSPAPFTLVKWDFDAKQLIGRNSITGRKFFVLRNTEDGIQVTRLRHYSDRIYLKHLSDEDEQVVGLKKFLEDFLFILEPRLMGLSVRFSLDSRALRRITGQFIADTVFMNHLPSGRVRVSSLGAVKGTKFEFCRSKYRLLNAKDAPFEQECANMPSNEVDYDVAKVLASNPELGDSDFLQQLFDEKIK